MSLRQQCYVTTRNLSRFTLAGLLIACATGASSGQTSAGEPSITVTGEGKVSARPDMAIINVGVVTQAPNAIEALNANSAAVEKLFHVLDDYDVAESDRQTTQFNIVPQYRRKTDEQRLISHYEVRNQVQTKVRDLQTLGPLLDELVGEGANQISGISFTVGEPTVLLDDARRKAVEDARRKAYLYAQATGLTLGRVISISEQGARPPQPMPGFAVREMAAAVPIASGEQEYHANVYVVFSAE